MNIQVYAVFDVFRGDHGERDVCLVGIFESEVDAEKVKKERWCGGRFVIPIILNKTYNSYEMEI